MGRRFGIVIHRGVLAAAAAVLFSTLAVACGSGESASGTPSAESGLIAYVVDTGEMSWEGLDIYLARADGTGRRRLTASGDGSSPAWSPDGRKLAFSCTGPTDGMGICIVNADGSGRHLVTTRAVDRPAWSPDGKTLAAHCRFQICLFDPDGKDFRVLTNLDGEQILSDLVWSPDSKSIAVSEVGLLGSMPMVVDADDGRASKVARHAGVAGWTRDGRLVLVAAPDGKDVPTFYAVDADGTDKHPLPADEPIVGPLWSPDGTRWLNSGPPEGTERLPRKLFVADRRGKSFGTVVSAGTDAYVRDSAWQPAS